MYRGKPAVWLVVKTQSGKHTARRMNQAKKPSVDGLPKISRLAAPFRSWVRKTAKDVKSVAIATGASISDSSLNHYPLALPPLGDNGTTDEGGKPITLSDRDILTQIGAVCGPWKSLEKESLKDAIAIAREGLDEVKGQTEYQDSKATRLLTITTFLSALSGALLARFLDSYPLRESLDAGWPTAILIASSYLMFGFFAVCSICGAIITFHATRTRFRYPSPAPAAPTGDFPRSLIFWSGILSSTPADWAGAFVDDKGDK